MNKLINPIPEYRPKPMMPGGLMLLTALLLYTGCAASLPPAQAVKEKTGPYYQDAQLCRAKSPTNPLPAGADPATSIDPTAYLKCMSQQGYQQEARTDPLLVAVGKCQQQGTKTVSASGATSVKPPSPMDVRDCLKLRGFPSTGTPPMPVSATIPATPKTGIKNTQAPTSSQKDDRQRIQTIYIPRKSTPSP